MRPGNAGGSTAVLPEGRRRRGLRLRDLMLGVAGVALGLAALTQRPVELMLGLMFAGGFLPAWLASLWRRDRAGRSFGVASGVILLAISVWTVARVDMLGLVVGSLGAIVGGGAILGFGVTWVSGLARDAVARRPVAVMAGTLAVALAAAAVSIPPTSWPLRLAVIISRPALERLADRVAAGRPIAGVERAGVFVVAGSALDAASGNAALVLDPNPGGRAGLIRLGPGVPVSEQGVGRGPLVNFFTDRHMVGRWWFVVED